MTIESERAAEQLADDFRHRHHERFHEHQVKAFELFAEAAEQDYPDTEGIDPGPWYFWFKAAANEPADE